MIKDDKKEEFLKLRIEGETFDSIAKKLGVSKQTLINWNKDETIKENITTARLMKYQSILKIYEQTRDAKIEYFANLTKKLKDELIERDLSNIQTDKLFQLILNSESKLYCLIPNHEYGGGYADFNDFELNPSFNFNPEDQNFTGILP